MFHKYPPTFALDDYIKEISSLQLLFAGIRLFPLRKSIFYKYSALHLRSYLQ